MNLRTTLTTLLLLTAIAALLPTDGGAVPAFARRHKLSCTECHAPFPRLKDFGEEFAGNGFVIPEDDKDRDYVKTGDQLLRLNRTFPVGIRFDMYSVLDSAGDVSSDLQTPWGLKMISGGTLSRNVGYYFYFYMDERGEVAGAEDAYIHFNDVGGKPLDFMIGQFQTSDPLMKRELRLTYEDYNIYKTRIGLSRNNLAYDRGVMTTFDLTSTTGLVGYVVNGNGRAEAGDDRRFDGDRYKNYGLRVSQDLGEHLRVGYYYSTGKETGLPDILLPQVMGTNELTYSGFDATIGNGTLDFNLQWLMRTDSDPQFDGLGPDVDTEGVVAELVLSPHKDKSRHYLTVLYNRIDSDLDAHDYETLTFGATYLMARNLRAIVEYTRDLEAEEHRAVFGLVSGF